VTGLLSSARIRRRFFWGGIFVLVAGGVAALVIAFPSPKPEKAEKVSNAPADIVNVPKNKSFHGRASDVLGVARAFVVTAVARHHMDASWKLTAPAMREGFTKRTWVKGDIPVVPFPVYTARWQLSYSYAHEVGLRVVLFARPKAKVHAVVFDMTLLQSKKKEGPPWLVSTITPAPSASGDFVENWAQIVRGSNPGKSEKETEASPKVTASHSGTIWLLLPAGIFGLLLVVLATVGIRSWRGAAAYKAYVRERQSSS